MKTKIDVDQLSVVKNAKIVIPLKGDSLRRLMTNQQDWPIIRISA